MFFKPGFKAGNTASFKHTASKGFLSRNLTGAGSDATHESNNSSKPGITDAELTPIKRDTAVDHNTLKVETYSTGRRPAGDVPATEEDEELEENKKQMLRISMFTLFSFFALGVIVFTQSEGWTFIDALYFVTVTLTTVGYGDQDAWSGEPITWFMCFYALFGIMLIGSALGIITAELVEKAEKANDEAQERMLDAQSLTPTSGGQKKPSMSSRLSSETREWFEKTFPVAVVKLSPSIFKMVFIIVLGMLLIFFDHKDHPDYETPKFVHCLYFAIITGTTIGYGDYSPQTQWGRALGIIYVFVAVIQLGNVLGDIAGHFIDAKKQEALEKILKKKITVADFEKFDVDGDGRIERTEFVLRKLMLMGILKTADVDRVEEEFDVMDADKSGEITMEDLQMFIKERDERIQEAIVVSPKNPEERI